MTILEYWLLGLQKLMPLKYLTDGGKWFIPQIVSKLDGMDL